MIDLDKAWDGLNIEQIDWSCGCGQPMALEQPQFSQNILKCSRCGPVAMINLSLELVPNASAKEKKDA